MGLCTILYTDSYRYQICHLFSHSIVVGQIAAVHHFKKDEGKAAQKLIYVLLFHLVIIYDGKSFKVQWCGEPCSFPFQA